MPVRPALAALVLVACGDPPAPAPITPEPVPEAEMSAAAPEDLARSVAPATEPPLVVGWPGVPEEPDPALRTELAAALALHRRGDFVASEAAFRTIAERAPTYVNARYDLACALVRLGRLVEAHAILVELVTAALPAIGGRLDGDADLADLRTAASWGELSALRTRAEAAVRAALDAGVVVLRTPPIAPADPNAEHRWRSIEIGVWLPGSSRFVPLAPVHTIQVAWEAPSLLAAAVDRERGVVLVAEGEGSWSEGDGVVPRARVTAYRLGNGLELGTLDNHGTTWNEAIEIHALPSGLAVRFVADGEVDPHPATRTVGEGSFDADTRPTIVFDQTNATVVSPPMPPPEGVVLSRLSVTLPGLEVPVLLARAHALRGEGRPERGEWWAEEDGAIFVLTGSLSYADGAASAVNAALSRIDRSTGAVELVASGAGAAQMVRAGDGALYAQVGDRVYRLGLRSELLPEGLLLVPDDPALYPYP